MSCETVFPGRGAPPVSAAVLAAHGGRSESTAPVMPYQPTVLRMIPVAGAIRRALPGSATVVTRPAVPGGRGGHPAACGVTAG